MDYRKGIEMVGDKSNLRFLLANKGKNPIIVLGLNPSTADEEEPDPTMKAVMRLAEYNGYDSFSMINLYPVRTPKPNFLPQEYDPNLHHENLKYIKEVVRKSNNPRILLAYGRNVSLRDYLRECRNDIIGIMQELESRFFVITYNQDGSPKHPLYCAASQFIEIGHSDLKDLLKM